MYRRIGDRARIVRIMNAQLLAGGLEALRADEELAALRCCHSLAFFNDRIATSQRLFCAHQRTKLITGHLLDREATLEATLSGIRNAVEKCTGHSLKQSIPLIVTVGTGGSGKTAYCESVFRWASQIEQAIKESSQQAIVHCLFVMSSFGEDTGYDQTEHGHAVAALTHRCYLDYTNAKHFSPANTLQLPDELSTIENFLTTIRVMEATKSGLPNPNGIAVVMLVDELMKVGDETSALLDGLSQWQEHEAAAGRVFIPIVTSLNVDVFTHLTDESQRPVFGVPLSPLAADGGLVKVEAALVAQHSPRAADAELRRVTEFYIKVAVAQTGGHLRTLESLFAKGVHFTTPFGFKPTGDEPHHLATLKLLLDLLVDPTRKYGMQHTLYGNVTVRDLAAKHIVVFNQINPTIQKVTLKIVPFQLLFAVSYCLPHDHEYHHEWALLRTLMEYASRYQKLENRFETIIPLALEMKARAVFRSQANAASLSDLLSSTDALIRLHEGHTNLRVRSEVFSTRFGAGAAHMALTPSNAIGPDELKMIVSSRAKEKGLELDFNMLEAVLADGSTENVGVSYAVALSIDLVAVSPVRAADRVRAAIEESRQLLSKSTRNVYVLLAIPSAIISSLGLDSNVPRGIIVAGIEACAGLLQPYGQHDAFLLRRQAEVHTE